MCQAATLLLLFTLTTMPARAQFAGGAGGADMMTQMAPMLEMMKAKMGKRRFAMLMQTMGPMMGRMMDGGGPAQYPAAASPAVSAERVLCPMATEPTWSAAISWPCSAAAAAAS